MASLGKARAGLSGNTLSAVMAGGWTRDAGIGNVYLTTSTDQVTVGPDSPTANRKLTIYETGANEGIRYNAEAANTTSVMLEGFVTGEAATRWVTDVGGVMQWGGGAGAYDLRIARSAASTLRIDNGALGAASVVGGADSTLTLGTATLRLVSVNAGVAGHRVYGAAADANPVYALGSTGLLGGAGGASATDVQFFRQAANIWETGDGDSLFAINATLGLKSASGGANPTAALFGQGWLLGAGGGSTPDIRGARSSASVLALDNNAGGALTVIGGADTTLTLGTATNRLVSVNAGTAGYLVYGSAGAANPVYSMSSTGFAGGAGGGSAVDVIIARQAANVWETGNGDAFYTVGAVLGVRAATGDANVTAGFSGSSVLLGAGGATTATVKLAFTSAATLTVDNNAGGTLTIVPAADNTGIIGTDALRFNRIRTNLFATGDFGFDDETCPVCKKGLDIGDDVVWRIVRMDPREAGRQVRWSVPVHTHCGKGGGK